MNTTLPFIGFIILTFIYFIVYFFLAESSNNVKIILLFVYWIFVVATQYGFAIMNSVKLCGSAQISQAFLSTAIPWVLIFGSVLAIINVFPSWKSPFSNTIGYLIVRMLGVKNALNDILIPLNGASGTTGKMLEEIYEDRSILINSMTPNNFSQRIQNLEQLVILKDEISRSIWYLMSGFIATSMSMTQLVSSECVKDKTQMYQLHQDWETKLALKAAQKEDPPKLYKMRE
jgi:hypothetical protein